MRLFRYYRKANYEERKLQTMIKKQMRIPKDWLLGIALIFLVVCEFLPIINLIPSLIISAGRGIAIMFFLLCVFMQDTRLGLCFLAITFASVLVTLWAYYQCWINYTTIGSFMLKNTLCWIYMEIGIYLVRYGSNEIRHILRLIICLLVVFTSITSLIVLRDIPTAVRELGNGSKDIAGTEIALYKRNTATWGELYGMVFLLPYIITWFKKKRQLYVLLLLVIIEVCVIVSQITTAIILSLCFLPFLVFKPLSLKQIASFSLLFVVLGIIILYFAAPFFEWLYKILSQKGDSVLALRAYQLYILFSQNEMIGTIGGRFDLYQESINTFLKFPLLGYHLRNAEAYTQIGLHSQILDQLAATGLGGFIPSAISFISIYRREKKEIRDMDVRNFFLLAIILVIVLMISNPTYYAGCIYLSIFWGPALILSKDRILTIGKSA